MKKRIIIFLNLLFAVGVAFGQLNVEKMLKYHQEASPSQIDNYRYSVYYTDNKDGYNLKGFKISPAGVKVRKIKINPAGYSYAVLSGKEKKGKVYVMPINSSSEKKQVQGLVNPTAIGYSPDSRTLNIADNGTLKVIDSKTLEPVREFAIDSASLPEDIVVSDNGYLLGVKYPDKLLVYNYESGQLRHTFPLAQGFSWAFTDASDFIGTLTLDGNLYVYSTVDFTPAYTAENLSTSASDLFFYPQGNYAGFIADGNRIQFVNLFNPVDSPAVYENDVTNVKFVKDEKDNLYLVDTKGNDIIYRMLNGFSLNYRYLQLQRVEEMLAEWSKMRPGETEEEYRMRVNEESMRQKRKEFANLVSTEFALTNGLGTFADVTLGQYNPADGTLIVSLGNQLSPIYLKVPVEDMDGFGDGFNLEFRNPVFSLTPENTFELIYVEVFNPTNGKTYVFDNLDGQNLDFLNLNDGFISLDLIMQSKREDVILQDIKERIIDEARKANLLSDYTTIDVNSQIKIAVDADGKKVKNNIVDFSYNVAPEGSAKEDFAPGKYSISDSPAAESLLKIIRQAFLSEFASYIKPGKKLIVTINGSADAIPVNRTIPYDGSLGEFDNEPCMVNGVLTALSVTSAKGITSNEQLGFMRARSLQDKLVQDVPEIVNMDVTYKNNIDVAKEKGAQYRRIKVSLEFVDALP